MTKFSSRDIPYLITMLFLVLFFGAMIIFDCITDNFDDKDSRGNTWHPHQIVR